MHRRTFLAGLASLAAAPATAQMKMDGMSHDMPGMDMGGHAGHDMGGAAEAVPTLPEGQPLRELQRLANDSTAPGSFKARLSAGPATAPLSSCSDIEAGRSKDVTAPAARSATAAT